MKSIAKVFCLTITLFSMTPVFSQEKSWIHLKEMESRLKDFDTLAKSKVMVLGTHHFGDKILEEKQQKSIQELIGLLSSFKPTKIVLELEPKVSKKLNANYNKFIWDSSFITNKHNEVYQLGFRLAKIMQHDSVYFFDNQTEFIGSLEGFTFDTLINYAKENDEGFYNKHMDKIISNFDQNQITFQGGSLLEEVILRNSPKAQKVNAHRMHSLEMRIGIQKNWMGPDWLGRWYRRNVRMMSNILKMNQAGDRILIIVGDNHKWVLDDLFEYTPDFDLVSSWDFFIKNSIE